MNDASICLNQLLIALEFQNNKSSKYMTDVALLKVSAITGFFSWLSDALTYPLDTISTRLKGQETSIKGSKHMSIKENFKFIYQSLQTPMKNKLYQGFNVTYIYLFSRSLETFIYQRSLHYLCHNEYTKNHLNAIPFISGCYAMAFVMLFQLPFQTVKNRLQMNTMDYQYSGVLSGLKETFKEQGLIRFYASTKIAYLSRVLFNGFQFWTFENLQKMINPQRQNIPLTLLSTLIAAIVPSIIVNPLEVMITDYSMVNTKKKKLVLKERIMRKYRIEGFRGFYKGFVSETKIHMIHSVFYLGSLELGRSYFGIEVEL